MCLAGGKHFEDRERASSDDANREGGKVGAALATVGVLTILG